MRRVFIDKDFPAPSGDFNDHLRNILHRLDSYASPRGPTVPPEFVRFRCTVREVGRVSAAFYRDSTNVQTKSLSSLRLQLASAKAWFDRCTKGPAKPRNIVICDLAVMQLSLVEVGMFRSQTSFTMADVQRLYDVINDFCDSELSARQRLDAINEPTTIIGRFSRPFYKFWKILRSILDHDTPPDPNSPTSLSAHIDEINMSFSSLLSSIETDLRRDGLRDALVGLLSLMTDIADREFLDIPAENRGDSPHYLSGVWTGLSSARCYKREVFRCRWPVPEHCTRVLMESSDLAGDLFLVLSPAKVVAPLQCHVVGHIVHGKDALGLMLCSRTLFSIDRQEMPHEQDEIRLFLDMLLSYLQMDDQIPAKGMHHGATQSTYFREIIKCRRECRFFMPLTEHVLGKDEVSGLLPLIIRRRRVFIGGRLGQAGKKPSLDYRTVSCRTHTKSTRTETAYCGYVSWLCYEPEEVHGPRAFDGCEHNAIFPNAVVGSADCAVRIPIGTVECEVKRRRDFSPVHYLTATMR